ncbi:MAG TPA: Glu/Leu/Phe/Val dehydrogenase dimerization domain-containing protein [Myxococcota bacterium]|nr:Glu/Leu/Phe/Val dehydrogenase dimerization domain-containing protein [Myxococcota bacterium]
MGRGLGQSPGAFAGRLAREAGGRGLLVSDPETGALRISHPVLEGLAHALRQRPLGWAGHEAVFLAAGPETGALFGAFVHSTVRGLAQGGVRRWHYPALEEFLRDGLRLAHGMSRKNALAGLWWGGGKGLIAAQGDAAERDPGLRRTLYEEYGAFVASLRGAYVAAEDVGTGPEDVAAMFSRCRFVTCLPPALGGVGNPSPATAQGVAAAMEAALQNLGRPGLEGQRVALQGCGQVGRALAARLLAAGARVVAADPSPRACEALAAAHPGAGAALEVRTVAPGDAGILFEDCDVLSPCALGGVLDAKTIPGIRAALVCGSANNQLGDETRDDRALQERGIVWVPDLLCNRMGIVHCGDEPFGHVADDPRIARHLDPTWAGSIPATTRRVLAESRRSGRPPGEVAHALADAALAEPHPLLGHRGRAIVASLVADRWAADAATG